VTYLKDDENDMTPTTNNGVFVFENFTITNSAYTPIACPYACCYFSFWNNTDEMLLKTDLSSNSALVLPQGASQNITATYFRADYRFAAGDILFFAQGVNQASSIGYLTTVKK